MRRFETGATRDVDRNKLDYEGFLSPLALHRYAEYMHKHRIQADGEMRDSDNWQKGIPLEAYAKSGFRHFMDWWGQHRGYKTQEDLQDSICALIFNAFGYLHELQKREFGEYTRSCSTEPKGHQGAAKDGQEKVSKRDASVEREETEPEVDRSLARGCRHDPFGVYGWCNICDPARTEVSSLGDATGYSHP